MTKEEADYWLAQLRQLLCVIKMDNIKGVCLHGEGSSGFAMAGQADWVRARHAPFVGDEKFDVAKVRTLGLSGYLPIPIDADAPRHFIPLMGARSGCVHEGTMMFAIFRRVIDEFLREVFRLHVDWQHLEKAGNEHWSVPVNYLDEGRGLCGLESRGAG